MTVAELLEALKLVSDQTAQVCIMNWEENSLEEIVNLCYDEENNTVSLHS